MEEERVKPLVGELAATRRHFDVPVEVLRVEVRDGLTEVREAVAGVRKGLAEVREGVAGLQKELTEVREVVEQGFRRSDVIAEGLRSEIRLLAEGVAVMSAGQEQLRAEMKEGLAELRSVIRSSYA